MFGKFLACALVMMCCLMIPVGIGHGDLVGISADHVGQPPAMSPIYDGSFGQTVVGKMTVGKMTVVMYDEAPEQTTEHVGVADNIMYGCTPDHRIVPDHRVMQWLKQSCTVWVGNVSNMTETTKWHRQGAIPISHFNV